MVNLPDLFARRNQCLVVESVLHSIVVLTSHLQFKSNQLKSNQMKSNQIKSNQIKSNQIKSNQIKSNQIKSKLKEHCIGTWLWIEATLWIGPRLSITISCKILFTYILAKRMKYFSKKKPDWTGLDRTIMDLTILYSI
ncbi:hypothetical protein PHYBLDRAFT_120167 [Phycomyces blakesleeanus NRRL 1555(-)]|uniref:Uncharacterized protein n=1 Tax=Phycomyces blakesleeanus (strain ATCC 8743b / DSM 1359 / FGSC 10004 / NBRC 33097 / NRRL 1555) TaxID=763407 RepID=A0A167J608_PHYB8|nr:hypothetical protein PHYBLDRAFT_120167 [Phycomyces blakesleeanus NRRL 1555(-)]OAD65229.1 hypothetical protein PHYBLDRAFT_120167 [Phycomyces blakesleeanus NRRL 1555(-)]|eukprot:XP_018283269.1 hypothetical protein PHYBLDRAFT_120167 [Phycomyces blakesleeanus NRRL 1555(-)]